MYAPTGLTQAVNQATNARQSFMGGFNEFLSGATDTFDTLLKGGLAWEDYRQKRDAAGVGQADLVNAVEKPNQTGASPVTTAHYANQGQATNALQGVSQNTLILAGAGVLAALLLLKR